MKTFFELREESNKSAAPKMTLKHHAEIKRALKAEIARTFDVQTKAIAAHAVAKDKLAAHEKLHPHYAEKQAARAKRELENHVDFPEPGRGREYTPSGGMGGGY